MPKKRSFDAIAQIRFFQIDYRAMSREKNEAGKELYRQLRAVSWRQLWDAEVPRFNEAASRERVERVAVIRAVGVVFSESGESAQREDVKQWLLNLLNDPCEKIRRYAMAALPKIGGGADPETPLLSLLKTTATEREKKYLTRALEKIGGVATLQAVRGAGQRLLPQAEQKIKASLARQHNPSAIKMDAVLADFSGLRIHLRGRRGLEGIVHDEAQELFRKHGKFRPDGVSHGLVSLIPVAPFSLANICLLRCFGEIGFVPNEEAAMENLASIIASPLAQRVLRVVTEGAIRYRLNFAGKGHQRGAVRALASQIYALCPEILNDARSVTWTIDVYQGAGGDFVEFRPNLTPDPRFQYRRKDVPAASHPPLAACMARLAGRMENEIVWDPFCGSGLELIESALLGGLSAIHATDLSAEAIASARENFTAARVEGVATNFACSDFREYTSRKLKPNSVSLIITNPPLGMRVPVNNLHGLIENLFDVAATVLRPGGRLVLANPLSKQNPHPALRLQYRQAVDFGGFDCRLEKYVKVAAGSASKMTSLPCAKRR